MVFNVHRSEHAEYGPSQGVALVKCDSESFKMTTDQIFDIGAAEAVGCAFGCRRRDQSHRTRRCSCCNHSLQRTVRLERVPCRRNTRLRRDHISHQKTLNTD